MKNLWKALTAILMLRCGRLPQISSGDQGKNGQLGRFQKSSHSRGKFKQIIRKNMYASLKIPQAAAL
jgi:hypothetical protein